MSDTFAFDFSDLSVESIEVLSTDSIEAMTEGHGMPEMGASCAFGFRSCVDATDAAIDE